MASNVLLTLRKPHLLFRRHDHKDDGTEGQGKDAKHDQCIRLQTYDELPAWYQDNPHVRTGYRPVSESYNACFRSLHYLHNETANIYTHAIPAIVLAFALPTLQIQISRAYADAPLMDRFMLTLTPITTLLTLSLSTTYHILMNHSHFISSCCLLLDFIGILALILNSFISGVYVGFYDSPAQQRIYWTMIVSLIAISCTLVLHPRLQGPRFRTHRTTAFILTALSGFAPVVHGMLLYGASEAFHNRGVKWWLAEGAWYGLGAYLFASRVPEKLCHTRFDIWGGSHQLFHCCVVVGAACHCWGVWRAWLGAVA